MGKDPAMLWYWSDWYSGTSLMSRHLKGCYMDVLHAQFNNGRLSLEEIKITLGSDFGSVWPALQKKFKTDESGLFFNERLEIEKERRKAFVASRSHDNSGRKKSYDNSNDFHTNNHTVNRDKNKNESKKKKASSKKNNNPVVYPWDSNEFLSHWQLWLDYKKEQHSFVYKSDVSLQGALKELSEIAGGNELVAIKIINKSITKGWKGLFKLSEDDIREAQPNAGTSLNDLIEAKYGN